jgi:oligosaccharide repeat unit polymerase
MILAVAYFVLLAALLAYAVRINKGFGWAGILAVAAYLFSAANMLVLMIVEPKPLYLIPTAYFVAVLLLFLLPHISGKRLTVEAQQPIIWTPVYTIYSVAIALPGYYSMMYSVPSAIRNLRGGIEASRSLVYAGQGISGGSMLSLLSVGFWPVALTFFVYAFLARRSWVLLLFLGVGSLSGAVYGVAALGRSGFVYWALFLSILLALTWPMMKVRLGKNITLVKIGVAVLAILTFGFVMALAYGRSLGSNIKFEGLNSRFGQSLYSIAVYNGTSLMNFQDFWSLFDDFGRLLYGQRIFPVYCGILERMNIIRDYDAAEMNLIYKPVYDAFNLEHAVFTGFQRELMMDFGRWGTVCLGVAYAVCSRFVRIRYEKRFSFAGLLLSAFLISIPVLGIFFFSYGELWANISIFVILLTVAVFSTALGRGVK